MFDKLTLTEVDEISVAFYGNTILLKRHWSANGYVYEASEQVPVGSESSAQTPRTRRLLLQQAGSLNHWCAEFEIHTYSTTPVRIVAWAETASPQDAVHALVRRMQQFVGLVGWS